MQKCECGGTITEEERNKMWTETDEDLWEANGLCSDCGLLFVMDCDETKSLDGVWEACDR